MLIDDQIYISKFFVSLLSRIYDEYKVPRAIKFMDTERRMVVARVGVGRMGSCCLKATELQFLQDEGS